MYSPTSCLEIRGQDQRLSNQASQTECTSRGLTGLATFEEYEQFEALQGFVEVLLEGSDPLWLGYYYDANGNVLLRGSGELSESPVFDDADNFAPGGVSAGGDGVCLTIGSNGQLQRRMCSDTLAYACYQDHGKINTPALSLSRSTSTYVRRNYGASRLLTLSWCPVHVLC